MLYVRVRTRFALSDPAQAPAKAAAAAAQLAESLFGPNGQQQHSTTTAFYAADGGQSAFPATTVAAAAKLLTYSELPLKNSPLQQECQTINMLILRSSEKQFTYP